MWKKSGASGTGRWCWTWSPASCASSMPTNWRNCGSRPTANGASPSPDPIRKRIGGKPAAAGHRAKQNLADRAGPRSEAAHGRRTAPECVRIAEDRRSAPESGKGRQRRARTYNAPARRFPTGHRIPFVRPEASGDLAAASRIGSARRTGEAPFAGIAPEKTLVGGKPVRVPRKVGLALKIVPGSRIVRDRIVRDRTARDRTVPDLTVARTGASRVTGQPHGRPGPKPPVPVSGSRLRGQARRDPEGQPEGRTANCEARAPARPEAVRPEAVGAMPAGQIAPPELVAAGRRLKSHQGEAARLGKGRIPGAARASGGIEGAEHQASARAIAGVMSRAETGCMKSRARRR